MTRPAVLVFVCALTLCVAEARQGGAVPPQGQQPPAVPDPKTGIILGKVVDGSSGAPIAEVTLTLSGAALAAPPVGGRAAPQALSTRRVISDGQGRFLFRDLPAGTFSLNASAGGYLSSGAGVTRPFGPGYSVTLPADGRALDLVIRMFKYATVSGIITDESGEPVVGATIRPFKWDFVGGRRRLSPSFATVTTDDRGMYRLSQLTPGDYAIGFVASSISMPAEVLVESERARAAGAAAGNAFSSEVAASGGNIITQASVAVGEWRLLYGTNARAPAPSEDGRVVMAYPTTFYAGSSLASRASIVTVASGEEKTGVDFQIRPVRTAKVSGTLMGPAGPAAFFSLRLLAADVDQLASETTIDPIVTTTSSTGAFTFLSVPAGSYVLKAVKVPDAFGPAVFFSTEARFIEAPRPDASATSTQPSLWATQPVQVGGDDVSGLVVTLKTGARVTGRVEFDAGTAPPPATVLKQASVSIEMPGGGGGGTFSFFQSWRGTLTEAGTFTSAQLPPGRYFVRSTVPSGPSGSWMLESIMANGQDVSDVAVEVGSSDINDVIIRFTNRPSQLSGKVRDAERETDRASVIVFPVDRALWTDYSTAPRRLRITRATSTGAFNLGSLPAGDYLVAAINDASAGAYPDPKFLDKLAALATRVTIDKGQTKTQDLSIVTVK